MAAGLEQKAFPQGEAADAAAFAGMQPVVLGGGHDHVGFGQAGRGQKGAPEARVEVAEKDGGVAGRPAGGG